MSKGQKDLYGAVLCAGFGQRLRPITENTPKPLLPFFAKPILDCNLEQLEKISPKKIFINGHHCYEKIKNHLTNHKYKTKITFFPEIDKIMGTGGAFYQLQPKDSFAYDLCVINGDIITNFSLTNLLNFHRKKKDAFATMAILPKPHPNDESFVWVLKERIVSFGKDCPVSGATPHGFACVQILNSNFVTKIKNEPRSIVSYYEEHIASGNPVYAYTEDALFFDLGTPLTYYTAHMSILSRLNQLKGNEIKMFLESVGLNSSLSNQEGTFYLENINLAGATILSPSFIGEGSRASEGATIGPYAVCIPKTNFSKDCEVSHAVVHAAKPEPTLLSHCLYSEEKQFAF